MTQNYIIKLAIIDYHYPPLQTWDYNIPPKGYALVSQEFHDIFYSTTPAGYVDIEVEDDWVISMTINQEALARAQAELEAAQEEQRLAALQPTQLDKVEVQSTYTAMMTDTLLVEEVATLDLHSAWYDKILLWYQQNLWTITMLKEAVEKNLIAQDEADEIINSK